MTAPSVVLLHGFLGGPSGWDPVVAQLAPQRVVVPSLPGHGPEPWHPPANTFESAADALLQSHVDGAPAPTQGSSASRILVGYSLGARLALHMALRHPDAFSTVILIGCNPGLRTDDERRKRLALDDEYAEQVLLHGLKSFVDLWESLPLFATQAALPPALQAEHRSRRLNHTRYGIAWALRTLGLGRMPSAWNDLPRLGRRLRIVSGAKDAKFTALAEEMAATNPAAIRHVVPNAGHDVSLEQPQALAAIIRAAIQEHHE